MKIILTHEYYSKFRQHNGRVVKTGTVPSTAPRSTLKPRGFWQWGFMHLIRTQATCFIFISTIISNSFQSPMGIFQPQPININHKQLFNHSHFSSDISHQFTTINIVHGLWTRGVYIYIYNFYNCYISLAFQHIYQLFYACIIHTPLI